MAQDVDEEAIRSHLEAYCDEVDGVSCFATLGPLYDAVCSYADQLGFASPCDKLSFEKQMRAWRRQGLIQSHQRSYDCTAFVLSIVFYKCSHVIVFDHYSSSWFSSVG